MGATLACRKFADTQARAGALRAQLKYWLEQSGAQTALKKHNSQLTLVTARLNGLLDRIEAQLESRDLDILVQGRPLEEKLLAAHTIWEFFRAKLAQRLDVNLARHLDVCDEYAWRCYPLAQERKIVVADRGVIKSPPLTFLNGGWSPYAVSRDTQFEVDRSAGEWLLEKDFREVVQSLPITLLGVPWFQVTHLPDVLVVAHEMGHIIEWDFDLGADLDQSLRQVGLSEGHFPAWDAWRPEVFADVFGCLAGGMPFASAVIDFIALRSPTTTPSTTAEPEKGARRVGWGAYPPAGLRGRVLLESLRALQLDVSALEGRLQEVFPGAQPLCDFEQDASRVALALLDCPCRRLQIEPTGRPPLVRELLDRFSATPSTVAHNISRGVDARSNDARVLVAASRLVWEEDPLDYADKCREEQIRAQIYPTPGMRGSEVSEAAERARGAAWFDTL